MEHDGTHRPDIGATIDRLPSACSGAMYKIFPSPPAAVSLSRSFAARPKSMSLNRAFELN